MLKEGYPAYTTSCAWLGYPDEQLKQVSLLSLYSSVHDSPFIDICRV